MVTTLRYFRQFSAPGDFVRQGRPWRAPRTHSVPSWTPERMASCHCFFFHSNPQNGCFIVELWIIYGLYMDYIWIIYGLYMDYIWIIMDYIWIIYGLLWIIPMKYRDKLSNIGMFPMKKNAKNQGLLCQHQRQPGLCHLPRPLSNLTPWPRPPRSNWPGGPEKPCHPDTKHHREEKRTPRS